jgi:alkylresorcinol/alkylpyrone synthase
MPFYFHATGTATPEHSVEQTEAAEFAQGLVYRGAEDHARTLATLFRRTQVRTRHSVLLESPAGSEPRQTFYMPASEPEDRGPTTRRRMQQYAHSAPELAVEASARALQKGGVSPQQITHVIVVTCTGFEAPGVDVALINQLGLPANVARTQVGFMGCHGALNGLRVAGAFAEADPRACILVAAVELCSLHYQYGWNSERLVSNALFADGAAAVVGGGCPPAEAGPWQLLGSGSFLMPNTEDAMTWRIGDHGFEMTLSAQVPGLIEQHLRPWLIDWLAGHRLTLDQIGSWAIHPGGPRIVDSAARALGLTEEAVEPSMQVFYERGNMSSPTLVFILEALHARGASGPCVALGFGPGLAVEAALLR